MTDLRKAVEMAVPLLIGYREYSGDHRIANRCGEVLEALRQALAQPEFDTPESHIVKWSIPVDPNNFGEALAQPQQDKLLVDLIQEQRAEIDRLRQALAQPEHGFDRTASHMAGEYVDTAGTEHQFKYVAYGLRADENGKLSIGELPKREWVGLTDEEILSAAKEVPITCIRQRDYDLHFASIIEAKLKEKNNAV